MTFLTLLVTVLWFSIGCSFLHTPISLFDKKKSPFVLHEASDATLSTQYFEGDVVEYLIEDNKQSVIGPFLGAIALSGPSSTVVKINQLCLRENCLNEVALAETREVLLYEHMGKDSVPYLEREEDTRQVQRVRILARWDDAQFTQRTVEDRVSNPHGEHAENVWLIPAERFRTLLAEKHTITIEIDSGH